MNTNDAKLLDHVARYNLAHRTPGNRVPHFMGIPLAAIAGLGFLSKIRWESSGLWVSPDLAWIALAIAAIWYVREGWRLSAFVILSLVGCYLAARDLSIGMLTVFSVVAVVCHWVGHYVFEHKPPLFFSRPIAVLEAPAWLLAFWTR